MNTRHEQGEEAQVPALDDEDRRPARAPYRLTMPAILRRAAALFGGQDYVVLPDRRITFGQLESQSRDLARRLLALGVSKGTRVGIHLVSGPEWAVVFAAVTRIGAVAMPFSTLFRPAELRTAMRVGDVSLLISSPAILGKDHEAFLEEAIPGLAQSRPGQLRTVGIPFLRTVVLVGASDRQWAVPADPGRSAEASEDVGDELLDAIEAEVTPADWMLILFTSGTTAEPKAIVHTHGASVRKTSPAANSALHAMHPGRILALMPFFWIGGLQEVLSALQSGATLLTLERLEAAAALELGRREDATSVMGNSKALQGLFGTTELRHVIPTLRPIPAPPWEGGPNQRGDVPTGLGMSETFGPWAAVDDFEIRVVDPQSGQVLGDGETGEFWVRGYGLMEGMYKHEREYTFEPDGFYRTGDLGYTENGLVYFQSRLKDMIKTKGANVAPAEVEAVLNARPEVRLSFVFGLPHETYGEEVVAAVVRDGDQPVDVGALLAACRRDVSSYKVPELIVVLDPGEIPYLPSSKPDRRAIKERVAAVRTAAAVAEPQVKVDAMKLNGRSG
jgi:acyl-CoA synthetase (AMP-forming)/AMP-acid ligase II